MRHAVRAFFLATSFAMAVGLAACASAASNFEAPIAQFSAAAAQSADALKALDKSATERLNALAKASAVQDPGAVAPRTDDCRTGSARCIVTVTIGPNRTSPVALSTASLIPNSARVMASLQEYGEALNEIAKADASEQVKDGVARAIGAVMSIAGAFGPVAGSLAENLNKPLTDAVVFAYQQYQESMKLDALRKATQAANPVIADAMAKLAAEAGVAQTSTVARLVTEYNSAFDALDEEPVSPANIDTLIQAASRLDAALTLKTSEVFTRVAAAHAQLTSNLQSEKPSFAGVFATLNGIIVEAKNIRDVANAFSAQDR